MQPSVEKMKELLWTMTLTRAFEDKLIELCSVEGKMPGMMILCNGQEGVSSGFCAALDPADVIVSNHRCHGHLIAKGASIKEVMAECFGKRTGSNKGKSGTLHIAVPEVNALCTTTVVGGGIPIAVGIAFAQKYMRRKSMTVCFFGNGAADEGSFHEALNLASLWELPVVFVCENNVYAGAQRQEQHTKIQNIADRAVSYAMHGEIVDGNDAKAVFAAAVAARERALAGSGPSLIECKTYRCRGHGESDHQLYQPREEIALWTERCPIPRLRAEMVEQGMITVEQANEFGSRAKDSVEEAVRFAEESPWPSPGEALEDVFA